jgi:hypothetical protein
VQAQGGDGRVKDEVASNISADGNSWVFAREFSSLFIFLTKLTYSWLVYYPDAGCNDLLLSLRYFRIGQSLRDYAN